MGMPVRKMIVAAHGCEARPLGEPVGEDRWTRRSRSPRGRRCRRAPWRRPSSATSGGRSAGRSAARVLAGLVRRELGVAALRRARAGGGERGRIGGGQSGLGHRRASRSSISQRYTGTAGTQRKVGAVHDKSLQRGIAWLLRELGIPVNSGSRATDRVSAYRSHHRQVVCDAVPVRGHHDVRRLHRPSRGEEGAVDDEDDMAGHAAERAQLLGEAGSGRPLPPSRCPRSRRWPPCARRRRSRRAGPPRGASPGCGP